MASPVYRFQLLSGMICLSFCLISFHISSKVDYFVSWKRTTLIACITLDGWFVVFFAIVYFIQRLVFISILLDALYQNFGASGTMVSFRFSVLLCLLFFFFFFW